MTPPTMISLFSGAGGMDYGFEAAGFDCRVALEMDQDAVTTLRGNRSHPVLHRDIHDVSASELLKAARLSEGEPDLLVGGPPCQPFSKAGYWANGDSRRLDDPRADTLYAFMRMVRDTLPRVFVLENVAGINYSGKEEGFHLLQRLTDAINRERGTDYQLSWRVIMTSDYGVPQLRTRFFLVAERGGRSFKFPEPTHAPVDAGSTVSLLTPYELLPTVTAWDAIGHLPVEPEEDLRLRGRWADLLPSIPEGENYLWHTARKGGLPLFGWRTRYWSFLLKLAKNRPSWTIQAQPGPAIGPFHWESRLLSRTELAALQTFPPDIVMHGSRGAVQRQLGNAVPSLFTEVLGRAIAEQFFGHTHDHPLMLAVPYRRPVPAAEPVLPVDAKFLALIGEHAEHPGTGKGPASGAAQGVLLK